MTNHINAMEYIAKGILSSATQFNGVIVFKFKGETQVLAYQDDDGIHVQRRQNTWEVYTPTYKEVYKKSWECWYVQELINTRNAITCHRWEVEEKSTPITYDDFCEWCDKHGFTTRMEDQMNDGSLRVAFYQGEWYMGTFVCGMYADKKNTPEVWYWECENAREHLTLTTLEELNKH